MAEVDELHQRSTTGWLTKRWVYVVLAAVMALAGCRTASSRNGAREVIVVGYQKPTAQTWGALIIKNQKLFEKHLGQEFPDRQITVEWFDSETGPPLNNGMVARKIQIAFLGDMPMLSNGAMTRQHPSYRSRMVAFDGKGASGQNQAIVTAKEGGVRQISDLEGKRLAVPFGTSAHRMTLELLRKVGLENQVTLLDLPIPVGVNYLKQGKVDALAAWEPYPTSLLSQGWAHLLAGGEVTGIDYLAGVVVDHQWAQEHPEYLKAFLKALVEAHGLTKTDPEQAARIFAEESGFDLEVCRKLVRAILFDSAVYQVDRKTLEGSAEFLQRLGKLSEVDLATFVDDAWLRSAHEALGVRYPSGADLAGHWSGGK